MPFWLVAISAAATGGSGGTGDTGTVASHTGTEPVVTTPSVEDSGVDVVTAASLAGETGGVGCAHAPGLGGSWVVGVLLLGRRR